MSVIIYNLNGTGTEIPAINIALNTSLIIIQGVATATGNYAISYTGTPNVTAQVNISYRGSLDITTNSTTFSILGQSFNQNDLNRELEITARWTGSTWKVITKKDFKEAGIIEASHLSSNSVTTFAIEDGAVTEPKLATNSVSTVKIQDDAVTAAKINADVAGLGLSQAISGALDVNVDNSTLEISTDTVQVKDLGITTSKINDLAVTSGKLADSSVTTAKILNDNITTAKIADGNVTANKLSSDSVTTVKINDNAVTNDKLANMTASSVKIGDASGNPTDLVLANGHVPIGNGTTVTTTDLNTLITATKQVVSLPIYISFESGEQTKTATCWFPKSGSYYLSSVLISVISDIAGTDNALIDVNFGAQPIVKFNTPNFNSTIIIPASTTAGNEILYSLTNVNSPVDRINPSALANYFYLNATKTTPGGKVIATCVFHEI